LLYGLTAKKFQLVNARTNAIERVVDREEMESEHQLRQHELLQQLSQAQKALKRLAAWVKAGHFGPGVSCSVAFRKKYGRIISPLRYVIEVHVPFKVSHRNLVPWPEAGPKKGNKTANIHAVPQLVDSVLTKVVETQLYRTHANQATSSAVPRSGLVRIKATQQLMDISSDSSIALSDTEIIGGLPTVETNKDNWGTLGIAFHEAASLEPLGLVNAHFSDGSMVQPPRKPRAQDIPLWDIGVVPNHKKFEGHISGSKRSEKFYVDAALIALNNHRSCVKHLVQDFAQDPFLFAAETLRFWHPHSSRSDAFKKVYKFGARTRERIEGYIENPMDTVPYYGTNIGNVIRARRNGSGTFTMAGDSGSALIAPIFDPISGRERFLVVGLCFAGVEGDKETLYACQFAAVMKALDLKLPATHLRVDWSYCQP